MVYPSEDYYYFRFPMRGLMVRGALTLYAFERDEGIMGFGYVSEIEDKPYGEYVEMAGRSHLFGPAAGELDPDEIDVATTFDESGLRFHLLFNQSAQRLYWILDESRFVPEALTMSGESDVAVGARTRFAFYCDTEYDRKILVAVHKPEVSSNTWYDGPFDQLPDTRIKNGSIEIKKYIVAHSKLNPEQIDRYGKLTRERGE